MSDLIDPSLKRKRGEEEPSEAPLPAPAPARAPQSDAPPRPVATATATASGHPDVPSSAELRSTLRRHEELLRAKLSLVLGGQDNTQINAQIIEARTLLEHRLEQLKELEARLAIADKLEKEDDELVVAEEVAHTGIGTDEVVIPALPELLSVSRPTRMHFTPRRDC